MRRLTASALLGLAMALVRPLPVAGQMGEIQVGGTVGYATPAALREGFGLVGGCGIARLVYVGARWTYHAGDRRPLSGGGDVSTRTHLLTADAGLMFPAGDLEIVPGVSAGVAWFRQSGPERARATELVVAPGVSVHVHIAGLVAIPEVQYLFVGDPQLPTPVSRNGPAATLRLVIPFELRRIIY